MIASPQEGKLPHPRYTKDELSERYPDDGWRRRFVDLTLLVDFLAGCVIKRGYRIPDEMNNAVQLTEYGKIFMNELVRQRVPAKEARLLCLLETAHAEPLVDVVATDIAALVQSISAEIASGDLRFPFIFGGELYNKAADLFPDLRVSLSTDETVALLDDTPQGIFQNERYLSGPFGLLTSDQPRWVSPTLFVPLFSCADSNCELVHTCRLSTNWDAPVNDHRSKMAKLLNRQDGDPSDWGEFISDLTAETQDRYNDFHGATLPYLLGDGLSESELRVLMGWLLDDHSSKGAYRDQLASLGIRSESSSRMTARLNRAQLLQLVLLREDSILGEALNHTVSTGQIVIPRGEVRQPVVNAGVAAGRFRVRAELGQYGVRFQPGRTSVANLRLRRLVDKLFVDNHSDTPELEWQLRGVDEPTIASKLDSYLRIADPRSVLARLVLARRSNVIAACTELAIDEHTDRSDDELIDMMLWKLGFAVGDDVDSNHSFWIYHDRMEQVVRTAGVSPLVDQDDLRSRSSNYFVKLEETLDDALSFVTWALVRDHYTASQPFVYTPDVDRVWAFEWLQAHYDRTVNGTAVDHPLSWGDKINTLHSLARGFEFLADELERMEIERDSLVRPAENAPKFAPRTDLQLFPFRHLHPYLDLVPSAQILLRTLLRDVSSKLISGRVAEVRNEHLHFRRSAADLEKLRMALEATKAAIQILEEHGMARLPYAVISSQTDSWSRSTCVLRNSRGRDVALVEPTSFDWLRLPDTSSRQYIFTAARFAEPNGVLRFRLGFSSDYAAMWSEFPRRRKLSPTLSPLRAREEARGSDEQLEVSAD